MSVGKLIILILALLIVFFALNYTGWQVAVKSAIVSPFTSLQTFLWRASLSFSSFFNAIFQAPRLAQELVNYQTENLALRAELALLEGLPQENETLRQTLKLALPKSFQLSEAQIIGLDVGSDLIFINRGASDGIQRDLPVITRQKALVGRVSEVLPHRSQVMLISHANSVILARVLGKDASGLFKGQGSGKVLLQDLPKEVRIAPGDTIVSAPLSDFYPKDLLLGEVSNIDQSDIRPFSQAEVKPFYLQDRLATVFVITNF